MCLGSSIPKAAPLQRSPEQADAGVVAARDDERRRRRAAASQTILTSPRGITAPAATTGKSLLGQ